MYNVTREGYSSKLCWNLTQTEEIMVAWDGVDVNIRNLNFDPFSLCLRYIEDILSHPATTDDGL